MHIFDLFGHIWHFMYVCICVRMMHMIHSMTQKRYTLPVRLRYLVDFWMVARGDPYDRFIIDYCEAGWCHVVLLKACISKPSFIVGRGYGLPLLRVLTTRLQGVLQFVPSVLLVYYANYTLMTQVSLAPGHYTVIVTSFYYSYFTHTLE